MRYCSRPVSFLHPGGRGVSANARMHPTIFCRSFLCGMSSISLAAEGLMRILYFATLLQILEYFVKWQIWFVSAFSKGGNIFRIFGET